MAARYLSYAKFNVYLAVLGEFPDGYHRIDSVLQTVSLADRLTFEVLPDPEIAVTCDHPQVPQGQGNLVAKALAQLRSDAGCARGMRVHIEKRIPIQAGLGGGSSNAACALGAASRMWGLGLSSEALEAVGATLGADVPFFVRGGTQRCEGRGEQVTPLDDLPQSEWIIVKPPWGLETAAVYRKLKAGLTSREAQIRMVLGDLAKRDLAGVVRSMFNDLESAAERLRPETGEMRAWLIGRGLEGVILSGSGSAHVGFCPDVHKAQHIEAAARERGWAAFRAWPVKGGWTEAAE
jgi:4-diphosphocytidyl-2-C-methyl-D-erythritol kinase